MAEQILRTAISIADREGVEALSMRRLARELSVTPMALYWHFDDKDRLLDAMAERVVTGARFVADPGDAWRDRLRAVLTTLVALLRDHRWMGRIVIDRVTPSPNYLAALEILLSACRDAGLHLDDAVIVTQHAVQAVVAMVEEAPARRQSSSARAATAKAEVRAALRSLPVAEFPNVRDAAGALTRQPAARRYYEVGIEMIVEGVAAAARSIQRRTR